MNIYNKNKKHWSQVQIMGCLHMRMLKNVSLHVIAVSITLAVRFFRSVLLSRNAVRFFYSVLPSRNLCFYAGDTHFILTLRVTSLDSRPKRWQSRPTSGSQGLKCKHIGGVQKFQRGSKYFCRIWTGGPTTTGVQILRDRPQGGEIDRRPCKDGISLVLLLVYSSLTTSTV